MTAKLTKTATQRRRALMKETIIKEARNPLETKAG
jgi:hypothetical protein